MQASPFRLWPTLKRANMRAKARTNVRARAAAKERTPARARVVAQPTEPSLLKLFNQVLAAGLKRTGAGGPRLHGYAETSHMHPQGGKTMAKDIWELVQRPKGRRHEGRVRVLQNQAKLVATNVSGTVVQGSGHWLMEEAPDQVILTIVTFPQKRMTAPIFKPPSGCPVTGGLFGCWVNLLRAESSRSTVTILRSPLSAERASSAPWHCGRESVR
jgi:hypothetical protein